MTKAAHPHGTVAASAAALWMAPCDEGRSLEGELKDLFKSAGYEFDDRFLG